MTQRDESFMKPWPSSRLLNGSWFEDLWSEMEDMPNDRDTKVLIPYGLSAGHAQGEKSAYSPLKLP